MQQCVNSFENLVCSDPKIWVFDDLLSVDFLDSIDRLFETRDLLCSRSGHGQGQERRAKSLAISASEGSQELVDAIRKVCPISEEQPCHDILISDVVGDVQHPHTDHVSLDDLARRHGPLEFLDLSKQSFSKHDNRKIVPTYSIIVYFNDVGGVRFPDAAMKEATIRGKRGRMIMFQNYVDADRPTSNPTSKHYGYYFDDIPKRVVTMGILANTTPAISSGPSASKENVPGMIYCPGVLDEPLRHDNPSYWGANEHYDAGAAFFSRPEPKPPKPDFLVTLTVQQSEGKELTVTCTRAMSGEELAVLTIGRDDEILKLRSLIEEKANPLSDKNVLLCTSDGLMLTADMDKESIVDLELVKANLKEIQALFAKADLNKDGYLSKEELKEICTDISTSMARRFDDFLKEAAPEGKDPGAATDEADAERRVRYEALPPLGGWKTLAPRWVDLTWMQRWEVVREYDKSGGDLKRKWDVKDEEWTRLFEEADANEDGRLNMNEFINWLFNMRFMGEMNAATLKSQWEAFEAGS